MSLLQWTKTEKRFNNQKWLSLNLSKQVKHSNRYYLIIQSICILARFENVQFTEIHLNTEKWVVQKNIFRKSSSTSFLGHLRTNN